MALETYNIQILCGDCKTATTLVIRNVYFQFVKTRLAAIKAMLETKLPKCPNCGKVPGKYNFVIKDQVNKVFPEEFFNQPPPKDKYEDTMEI
jgi:hypothetical protein